MEMSPEEKQLLYQIKNDLGEIKRYLYNDELTGTPGTIQKVSDIDLRVKKLEETHKIEAAKKALLVFIGGLVVTVSQWLFKVFLNQS